MVLLLFSAQVPHDGQRVHESFAFVRWYCRTGRLDVLKCTRLKWRSQRVGGRTVSVCGVIPLSTILRTVDLQPDHAGSPSGVAAPTQSGRVGGAFYVNKYKWS